MPVKIVFLDRETLASHIKLREPAFAHVWVNYPNTATEQISERLAGCEIAIINKVPLQRAVLNQLPDLRMIAVAATGTDMVDRQYCDQRGIMVSNVRNYATTSVPEHALGLLLTLRRSICAYRHAVQSGEWQKSGQFCFFNHPIDDLAGNRLGIIGAGALGKAMAKLGRAIGMEVVIAERKNSTSIRPGRLSFDEVIASSEVLSLHCPLTPETSNMITEHEFVQMRETALLINTARGGLVNEQDLVAALRNGAIAGAGFDVLTQEPPQDDHPLLQLLQLPNFVLTPHIAWASTQAMQTLADQLIDNIESFMAGKPVKL